MMRLMKKLELPTTPLPPPHLGDLYTMISSWLKSGMEKLNLSLIYQESKTGAEQKDTATLTGLVVSTRKVVVPEKLSQNLIKM